MAATRRRLSNWRVIAGLTVLVVLLAAGGWYWSRSLLPSSYSVMDMGTVDFGGGPEDPGHAGHGDGHADGSAGAGAVSVADLTGPQTGKPAVNVLLTARKDRFTLPGGKQVNGYTLNGKSPGPLIRAKQGDLVQVTLVNDSVPDGVTLHWHGIDVPNAEDGVAGVTQDAVAEGGRFVYRFVAEDPGTYWYHSHQVSHEQVRGGLFGTFVVESAAPASGTADLELIAPVHTYSGTRTADGRTGARRVQARPGAKVRVRVIDTDDGPLRTWVTGAPYRVVAYDGRDVHGPTDVANRSVLIGGGGRVDLEFTVPRDGSAALVGLGGGGLTYVVGPADAQPPTDKEPTGRLDMLSYGAKAPIGFDPARADRRFDYDIGRWPGLIDGKPGLFWTINGHLYPDVPMFVVAKDDVVVMSIKNGTSKTHPIHLHGHHVVVLSRGGKAATGSPWWVDTLNLAPDEEYDVAFVADNPGIWMDHCHNLPHAADGMVAHLAYTGVTEPYRIGGPADNEPE